MQPIELKLVTEVYAIEEDAKQYLTKTLLNGVSEKQGLSKIKKMGENFINMPIMKMQRAWHFFMSRIYGEGFDWVNNNKIIKNLDKNIKDLTEQVKIIPEDLEEMKLNHDLRKSVASSVMQIDLVLQLLKSCGAKAKKIKKLEDDLFQLSSINAENYEKEAVKIATARRESGENIGKHRPSPGGGPAGGVIGGRDRAESKGKKKEKHEGGWVEHRGEKGSRQEGVSGHRIKQQVAQEEEGRGSPRLKHKGRSQSFTKTEEKKSTTRGRSSSLIGKFTESFGNVKLFVETLPLPKKPEDANKNLGIILRRGFASIARTEQTVSGQIPNLEQIQQGLLAKLKAENSGQVKKEFKNKDIDSLLKFVRGDDQDSFIVHCLIATLKLEGKKGGDESFFKIIYRLPLEIKKKALEAVITSDNFTNSSKALAEVALEELNALPSVPEKRAIEGGKTQAEELKAQEPKHRESIVKPISVGVKDEKQTEIEKEEAEVREMESKLKEDEDKVKEMELELKKLRAEEAVKGIVIDEGEEKREIRKKVATGLRGRSKSLEVSGKEKQVGISESEFFRQRAKLERGEAKRLERERAEQARLSSQKEEIQPKKTFESRHFAEKKADFEKGVSLLKTASTERQGILFLRNLAIPEGYNELGKHYATKDIGKAYSWYHLAAEKGHPEAWDELGRLYEEGKLTELDDPKLRTRLGIAKESERRQSQKQSGSMSRESSITHTKAAFEHYLKATELGSEKGRENLTRLINGTGISGADRERARLLGVEKEKK